MSCCFALGRYYDEDITSWWSRLQTEEFHYHGKAKHFPNDSLWSQHFLNMKDGLFCCLDSRVVNFKNQSDVLDLIKWCGKEKDLCKARRIHSKIQKQVVICRNVYVSTALVSMYAKCGTLHEAQRVFDELPIKNIVSWTALISGYARAGNSKASRNWYNKMRRAWVVPNKVTFVSLLCACSHGGLIDEGVEYFESMKRDYGMIPETDHIVYMVDLIARAGDLSKVEAILSRLSIQPSITNWLSLLGACQRHGNVSLGEKVFKQVLKLQPNQDLAYVLMSNIYMDATHEENAKLFAN